MTGRRQYRAPAVRELAAVVDQLAPEVSGNRLKQLRMIVGMWDRAVGRDGMPGPRTRSARRLFQPDAVAEFWDLAVEGELWADAARLGHEMPLATRRIVRDCLHILARRIVGNQGVRLPQVVEPGLRDTTTPRQEAELFRFLVSLASGGPLARGSRSMTVEYRARLLALTAVALDTRSRVSELAAMTVADLGEDSRSVRVRRRQQNGAHLEPLELVLPLREGTGVALRRWLKFREDLVALPEGAKNALWVTLAPTWLGPPGLPISAEGLGRSYVRGVVTLNYVMAGSPGWEPLPLQLEGLRRAAAVPEEERVLLEKAAREAAAQLPKRRGPRPLPPDRPRVHGRESCYNTGCREPECREAARRGRATRKARAARRRA
ncbi:hypothetical protein [Streptomyces sp. NRRL F-5135]|uniref:hypothetical protein n=1 Tax=Streptomyces sp. NRRL F-5135 TaxID=1463858 RepID=UPI0005634AAF|nr:hypothetical protein [Streptomyces sp. NRRL F-5135]